MGQNSTRLRHDDGGDPSSDTNIVKRACERWLPATGLTRRPLRSGNGVLRLAICRPDQQRRRRLSCRSRTKRLSLPSDVIRSYHSTIACTPCNRRSRISRVHPCIAACNVSAGTRCSNPQTPPEDHAKGSPYARSQARPPRTSDCRARWSLSGQVDL